MRTLNYDGLVEPWKIELIVNRAKQMGFRGSDLDDIQQDIIQDLMCFRFDPAKSNGASESTVLIAVIDHYLTDKLRSDSRRRVCLDRLASEIKQSYDPTQDERRILDMQRVIETLPPRERDICNLLAQGCSIHEIAKMRVWGWHTVERLIGNIRERFEEVDLCEERRD